MSFFNWGIWRLRSCRTAVSAGLDKEEKQCDFQTLTKKGHGDLPEADGQHGFQEFLNIWLDAGTHGSGKHADASKHCGVYLHGLLSPARNRGGTEKSEDTAPAPKMEVYSRHLRHIHYRIDFLPEDLSSQY